MAKQVGRPSKGMDIPITVHVTKKQRRWLDSLAKKSGINRSETIRDIFDSAMRRSRL